VEQPILVFRLSFGGLVDLFGTRRPVGQASPAQTSSQANTSAGGGSVLREWATPGLSAAASKTIKARLLSTPEQWQVMDTHKGMI